MPLPRRVGHRRCLWRGLMILRLLLPGVGILRLRGPVGWRVDGRRGRRHHRRRRRNRRILLPVIVDLLARVVGLRDGLVHRGIVRGGWGGFVVRLDDPGLGFFRGRAPHGGGARACFSVGRAF